MRGILAALKKASRAEDYREGGEHGSYAITDIMYNDTVRSHGFFLGIIVGKLGTGKSNYAFKTAVQYLARRRLFGNIRSLESRLRYVFRNYTVFFATRQERLYALKYYRAKGDDIGYNIVKSMWSLEEKLTSVSWHNKLPILIWDDAGVGGSAYRFFVDKYGVMTISGLLQVARRRCDALLITTPHPKFVLSAARNIPERYVVVVESSGGWTSNARGYQIKLVGTDKDIVKLVFQDVFSKRVPDKFYREYMTYNDKYVEFALILPEFLRKHGGDIGDLAGELEEAELTRLAELCRAYRSPRRNIYGRFVYPSDVLATIVFYNDVLGAEPRYTNLAYALGMGEKRVRKMVKQLVGWGLVSEKTLPGKGSNKVYRATLQGYKFLDYTIHTDELRKVLFDASQNILERIKGAVKAKLGETEPGETAVQEILSRGDGEAQEVWSPQIGEEEAGEALRGGRDQ